MDVKLAVEAMQLAYRHKMSHAFIFSGDGDFLPLIDALVSEGIMVTVISFFDPEKTPVASRLRDAADGYVHLDWELVGSCLKREHAVSSSGGFSSVNFYELGILERQGHKLARIVLLENDNIGLIWSTDRNGMHRTTTFKSQEGAIVWARLKYGSDVSAKIHDSPIAFNEAK